MSKAVLVKRGDKYLPGVQLSELEELCRYERSGKSRDSLQAGPNCSTGMGQDGKSLFPVCDHYIYTISRICNNAQLEGSSRKDGWSDCIWNVGA